LERSIAVEKNLISSLTQFGLTGYEARIYYILVSHGAIAASKLAKLAGIQRPHIYPVLKGLQEKGLVMVIPESIPKYQAVPLKEGLAKLIESKEKALTYLKRESERLERAIKQEKTLAEEKSYHVLLHFGRENIHYLMKKMFNKCNKELLCITTSNGLLRKLKFFKAELSQMRNKNIKIHFLCPMNREVVQELRDILNLFEIRHIDTVSVRLIVIDESEILLSEIQVDDLRDTGEDIGVWSDSKELAKMIKTLFESTWDAAIPAKDKIKEIIEGRPVGEFALISGRSEIERKINEVIYSAKREVCSILSSNELLFAYKELYSRCKALNARKVKQRILLPITKETVEIVKPLLQFEVEVKHTFDAFPRTILVDNEIALLGLAGGGIDELIHGRDCGILINHISTIEEAKRSFEQKWSTAIDAQERISELIK
jgi:sugar-specific transcriptional regulator TrmB